MLWELFALAAIAVLLASCTMLVVSHWQ